MEEVTQSKAYEKLKFYQNICEIRRLVYVFTEKFSAKQMRLVSQMRDAARSAKQNIREGYSKDSAGEFGYSIRISRGSLDELEGDLDDCLEDKLLSAEEHDRLKKLVWQSKFLIDRYLDALNRLTKEGKWKLRFKR